MFILRKSYLSQQLVYTLRKTIKQEMARVPGTLHGKSASPFFSQHSSPKEGRGAASHLGADPPHWSSSSGEPGWCTLWNSFSKISSTLRSSGWRCIVLAGSGPSILIFCQRSPCLGRSKSQASSNIVIPRLKTSHAFVNRPCNVSGARYLRRIKVKRWNDGLRGE